MVLELGSTDRPVDLIAEGVDCVIRGGLVHDDTLVARPLGSLRVVTCAAPGYLATHGTLAELQDPASPHRFVNFHSPKTGRVFPFEFMQGKAGRCCPSTARIGSAATTQAATSPPSRPAWGWARW